MSELAMDNLGPNGINMPRRTWAALVKEGIFPENATFEEVAKRLGPILRHGGLVSEWTRQQLAETCNTPNQAEQKILDKMQRGRERAEKDAADQAAALRRLLEKGGRDAL